MSNFRSPFSAKNVNSEGKTTSRIVPSRKGKKYVPDKILTKSQIDDRLAHFNKKVKREKKRGYGQYANLKMFQAWHLIYLRSLNNFIENPYYNKKCFNDLLHCKSEIKGLQKKQRITLCKVSAVLMLFTEAQHGFIGMCEEKEMHGVSHQSLRETYYPLIFGETITQGRWDRAIKHLKLADCFVLDEVRLSDEDIELDETTGTLTKTLKVRSVAACKAFQDKFFRMIASTLSQKAGSEAALSQNRSIIKRVENNLSNVWGVFKRGLVTRRPAIGKSYPAPVPQNYHDSMLH